MELKEEEDEQDGHEVELMKKRRMGGFEPKIWEALNKNMRSSEQKLMKYSNQII